MILPFVKMQGAGNDFMVVNAVETPFRLTADDIRRLADRRFGVGFDQLLVVEKPETAGADFKYRIFNADGGEVEMCGNGARCFAVFVREAGLTDKTSIVCDTKAGRIVLKAEADGRVTVNMGVPVLDPAASGFDAVRHEARREGKDTLRRVTTSVGDVWLSVVSMGNPHAVLVTDDTATAPVAAIGADLQVQPDFAHKVNVGFLQVKDRRHAKLRVYERGAGETLACGTGASAAAVAGMRRGLLDDRVEIAMKGGTLGIAWAGEGHPVFLTGPAVTVFAGTVDTEQLRTPQA